MISGTVLLLFVCTNVLVVLVLMMTLDIPATTCHPQLHGKIPPLSHCVGLCSSASSSSVAQAHWLLSEELHKYTATSCMLPCAAAASVCLACCAIAVC